MSTTEIKVPGYGTVSGIIAPSIKDGSVVEFRGIPYGKIPGRFEKSVLYEKLEGPHDGSKFGPMCPSIPIEVILNDDKLDLIAPPPNQGQDEFKCLNLNIAAPKAGLTAGKKLPVLVWIHGGGFTMGANTDRYAAIASLCKQSIQLGKPMIVVSINYRLGYFGFLASKQLKEANASRGGGAGNWGLFDQRVALQWIQMNIAAFEGDPKAVTAMGHSAGGASINGHLLAGQPLFSRGILASGVLAGVLGPRQLEEEIVKGEYDSLLEHLKISSVEELQKVPVDKLMQAHQSLHPGFAIANTVDDSQVPGGFFTLGGDQTEHWIYNPKSANTPVMLGDAETEGNIFVALFQNYPPEQLLTSLQKRLPASLLKEWKLDANSAPPATTSMADLTPRLIQLCSDIPFIAPAAKFATLYPGPVYSYHFDRPSQFEGPMKGIANHGVDMSYAFGGHMPHFPDDLDREISKSWMGYIIAFVNGEEPWPARGEKGNSMVVSADGKIGMHNEVGTRRWAAFREQMKCWNDTVAVWKDVLAMKL